MAGTTAFLERVRQEQVASIYRNGSITVPITWTAALVLMCLLLYLRAVAWREAALWFGLISLQSVARIALHEAYRHAASTADWRRWGAWFAYGAGAGGLAWGLGSLLIMAPGRFDLQLLVLTTIFALVYGALSSFGRYLPAFFGFYLPALVPSVIWSALQHDAEHFAYAVLLTIWLPLVGLLAWRFHQSDMRSMLLAFENQALAEDLQAQKALAEEANAAKSRFLASASHDLRQPVHALGMFVGALKNERAEPAARKLVEQIDGVVASLDALFAALLDMSKLDAGVVRAEVSTFAVRPMLERVFRETAPAAEARSLRLHLAAPDVWLRSDPVLLERIVRNLATNAVRYTAEGGVVIAVRAAGRSEAAIEVWDTGPGIAEDQRALVFQEFYQGGGARAREGLGLGLAIVRRLSALLGHDLTLQSRAGRGSVFRVRVPIAAPPAKDAPVSEADAAISMPAHRIWVIDDDDAARAGAEALLRSWGHDVLAAASSGEMLAAFAVNQTKPDIVLCDFRLGEEDGIAAVRALRSALGASVPAALITGDTGPERLREAAASGLPILHKPLAKARLRALIGNLTRGAVAPV